MVLFNAWLADATRRSGDLGRAAQLCVDHGENGPKSYVETTASPLSVTKPVIASSLSSACPTSRICNYVTRSKHRRAAVLLSRRVEATRWGWKFVRTMDQNGCAGVTKGPEPVGIRGLLRVPLTPLVGREDELSRVQRLLERPDVRLVALVGPGGVGKTRLAIAAARNCSHLFAHGLVFVDLASITEPREVPAAIARAVGLQEHAPMSVSDALREYVVQQQLLVVLDNFEHLLAAATFVSELVAAGEQLKVLVTSRSVLHVYGEHDVAVAPLPLPADSQTTDVAELAQSGSIQLFVERAQAAQPEFTLNTDNAAAVADICRCLDGLPLAIELAAARIRLLPPRALLTRLQSRLPLLVGGARDLPERLQSLRAAIDWSYNQLTAAERTLFCRLAVFAGGFTLEAAAAVNRAAGPLGIDTLDGVSNLLDASLIFQTEDAGGEPRFRMLETIREFALDELASTGELDITSHAYVDYCVDFVEAAEREELGPEQRHAWQRLNDELDNIRGALRLCLDSREAEPGLRLVGALALFWQLRGHPSEGRDWAERVLALSNPERAGIARVKTLIGAGRLAWVLGEYAQAGARHSQAQALAEVLRVPGLVAQARYGLGLVAMVLGESGKAEELMSQSLEEFADAGNALLESNVCVFLGWTLLRLHDWQTSRALMERALPLARKVGNPWGIAIALLGMGIVATVQGDFRSARTAYEEGPAIERGLGRAAGAAQNLIGLGWLALEEGRADEAKRSFSEALVYGREIGRMPFVAESLEGLACAAAVSRHSERGHQLLGAQMPCGAQWADDSLLPTARRSSVGWSRRIDRWVFK
jgi:predicted ATPase